MYPFKSILNYPKDQVTEAKESSKFAGKRKAVALEDDPQESSHTSSSSSQDLDSNEEPPQSRRHHRVTFDKASLVERRESNCISAAKGRARKKASTLERRLECENQVLRNENDELRRKLNESSLQLLQLRRMVDGETKRSLERSKFLQNLLQSLESQQVGEARTAAAAHHRPAATGSANSTITAAAPYISKTRPILPPLLSNTQGLLEHRENPNVVLKNGGRGRLTEILRLKAELEVLTGRITRR